MSHEPEQFNLHFMSAANPCDCKCPTPAVVEIPGVEGSQGDAGSDGVNAFTVTTADFTVPAIGSNVTVLVGDSTWASVGQNVFVEGAGVFSVVSKPGSGSLVLQYLDYDGNTASGNTITAGAQVSPAGTQPDLSAGLPTAITDNSTGTASDTIAAGAGVFTLSFPITLASMTNAAADLMTNYVVGFAFKILSVSFVTTTIGAGAAASQVLNLEIGTTNVTGGVVTITLAGTDTLGELTAGTAVTAANTGSATDTLSVEVAAGGTVFSAGDGVLLIRVQNMDEANAIASLADHVKDLIIALT
jgi:hypothetical protein